MTEPAGFSVERVDETSWRDYRAARLAMLADSPRAFWTTLAEAEQRSDEWWLDFVRGGLLWIARRDEAGPDEVPIGSAGLWHQPDRADAATTLVGMWVAPGARGLGVADALLGRVIEHARRAGRRSLFLDVADENVRAIAFYRRHGFVPTGNTAAFPWDATVTESEMVLSLGVSDPGES